jgi:2-methylcitrate dehydratase
MESLVDQIAGYSEELSYEDLPPEVVARTKELILDSVGCALGGSASPPALIAQAMAAETFSSRPSTVLATGQKTSPDLATFANGIMTRYLDYNDTYLGGGHPSDMLAPVLASVDAVHGDGKAAILATSLGTRSTAAHATAPKAPSRPWASVPTATRPPLARLAPPPSLARCSDSTENRSVMP